jgi:PAS domain-containing protein
MSSWSDISPILGLLAAFALGAFVVIVFFMEAFRRREGTLVKLRHHLNERNRQLEQLNRALQLEIEERRQREKEMRRLLHNARCIVWSADLHHDGAQYQWKLKFFEEEKLQEFIPLTLGSGQNWPDAWYLSRPVDDQRRTDENFAEALRNHRPQYDQEFRVRRADGSIAWVFEDVQVEYLPDAHYHLVGVCTDITAKKKSEEELKAIMKTARCLIWHAIVEDRGESMHWNIMPLDDRAAQEFLALDVQPGATWHKAWFDSWDKGDLKRMDQTSMHALRSGQPGYSQEFRCHTPDGSVRWLYEDAHIERIEPGKWHVVGVCTDVTKRKAAEKELEYVISGARCLLWHAIVEERDGALTWQVRLSNEESVSQFLPIAIRPDGNLVESWQDSKVPEDVVRMNDNAREALHAGKGGYSQEFRCRRADGQVRWLYEDVRVEPLRAGVRHLVGICADITERKTIEEERESLIKELREALQKVKTLSGLLPICAACKKVRDDQGYWDQIDSYVRTHSQVEFSHSICPECMDRLYPEYQ